MRFKFNDNSVLCISELNFGFPQFMDCIITESMYGELPTLDISVRLDEQLIEVNKPISGYIINPRGLRQDFKGYVYNYKYFQGTQQIGCILTKKEFQDTATFRYDSMINAITSTYPGEILTELTYNDPIDVPDVSTEGRIVRLYQKLESNSQFCTKCCWSYRKDYVFGYTIEGLKFLDLKNQIPIDEVSEKINLHVTTNPEFSDSKYYSKDSDYVIYSLGDDPYHANVVYNNQVMPVDTEYIALTENFLYNQRYKSSKLVFNAKTKEFFSYRLGDVLRLKNSQFSNMNIYVVKRILSFTQSDFNESIVFHSIDI